VTQASELVLPSFDYTDVSLRGERFHEEMARVAAEGWLAEGPFGYITLDRESADFFLRSRAAIFPGMKIAEIFGVTEGPLYEQMRRNILHVNGAHHTRLRALLNPALSPRAVERYRPAMRGFLGDLFDEVAGGDGAGGRTEGAGGRADRAVECEFVEAFAKPYPARMIATVMGAPVADADRLHDWSNRIQRQFDAVSMASEREDIERAVEEFYVYAEELLGARRVRPADDLISSLIAAEQQGDRLDDVECINVVFNVLVGGVDTTQSQLAHAVRLLSEHPDQWRLLRERPELAQAAVEEALRFEPITPFTARILTQGVEFRGVEFPEGTIVMVCAFTGNRDVADVAGEGPGESGRFDIAADRGGARPLTFGAGPHYCVGANLARAELQEALGFLAEHVVALEPAGEPSYGGITGIYGLAELPLRLTV
jgi:cytochrome P450